MPRSYKEELEDISKILSGMNKEASSKQAMQEVEKSPTAGKQDNLPMPGKKVDKSKEKNEAKAGLPSPNDVDPGTKSVKDLVDGKKKTAKAGDTLMQQIYNALYKASEDIEEKECEEEPCKEEPASDKPAEESIVDKIVAESDKPSEEDVVLDKVVEDIPITEENAEEIKDLSEEEKEALKTASASEKKAYFQAKIKGFKMGKLAALMLKGQSPLCKVAQALIAPHLDEIVSFETGRQLAQMEKAGHIVSTDNVQYAAGQIIAGLEKAGALTVNKEKLQKIAAEMNGQDNTQITKQASETTPELTTELIKQAAESTTQNVIGDLFKIDVGQNVNNKLKQLTKMANPR